MHHNLRSRLNWLDRSEVQRLLEDAGFAVYDHEDTDDLRDALDQSIRCGDIADPTE